MSVETAVVVRCATKKEAIDFLESEVGADRGNEEEIIIIITPP